MALITNKNEKIAKFPVTSEKATLTLFSHEIKIVCGGQASAPKVTNT